MGLFFADKFSHQVDELDDSRSPGDSRPLRRDGQWVINVDELTNLFQLGGTRFCEQ